MKVEIFVKEDAVFIADSHYNLNRQELKIFLLQIQFGNIKTSQLFLVGDIFDFLSAEMSYFKKQNQEMINILNELSNQIEIIYLEGNHDYNLKSLFPNILVIPRQQQPLCCIYNSKKIAISHGDIFTPFGYNLYTLIIRNSLFLKFLNSIDINNWLTKKIDTWLLEKDICNKCDDFKQFSQKRINLYKEYKVDIIIEGHFHFANKHNNYINIPSLCCDKLYYKLKSDNFQLSKLNQ